MGVGLEELDGSDGEEEALVEREVILEPRDLLTRWVGRDAGGGQMLAGS